MAISPADEFPAAKVNPGSAGYPYGSARNVTVSGDGTGTPRTARYVNDHFGFYQELLTRGSLTPSGEPDQVGGSQYYTAMRRSAVHAGVITYHAINSVAVAAGIRMLYLVGQTVLVDDYQDLVDACWEGAVANPLVPSFYKTSDPAGLVRDDTGDYFVLPDMTGQFIRAVDSGGSIDPDRDSGQRKPGGVQGYAFQWHAHQLDNFLGGGGGQVSAFHQTVDVDTGGASTVEYYSPIDGGSGELFAEKPVQRAAISHTEFLNDELSTNESRPKNVCFYIGIWY